MLINVRISQTWPLSDGEGTDMSQTIPLGSTLRVDVNFIIESVCPKTLFQAQHLMGELLPAKSWV